MIPLIVFLLVYGVCYWFLIMPKFYPTLGEIRWSPISPEGNPSAVKFVGAALVGMVAGVFGFFVGYRLPARASVVLHVLAGRIETLILRSPHFRREVTLQIPCDERSAIRRHPLALIAEGLLDSFQKQLRVHNENISLL